MEPNCVKMLRQLTSIKQSLIKAKNHIKKSGSRGVDLDFDIVSITL